MSVILRMYTTTQSRIYAQDAHVEKELIQYGFKPSLKSSRVRWRYGRVRRRHCSQ